MLTSKESQEDLGIDFAHGYVERNPYEQAGGGGSSNSSMDGFD